jgi:hypothetical protein
VSAASLSSAYIAPFGQFVNRAVAALGNVQGANGKPVVEAAEAGEPERPAVSETRTAAPRSASRCNYP